MRTITKLVLFIIFSAVFIFVANQTVQAQAVFNDSATGNLNAAATWTLTSGTDADGIPDSDDDIIIDSHTVTISASSAVHSVTINAGGTFQCTSAGNPTLSVNGNWTNGGGTTNIVRGTVNFNGAGAQNINGTALTQTFCRIATSNTSALVIGGSTTTLTLSGSSAGNLTLGAGTSLDAGTATNINVNGNWTNSGATFTPRTGNVTFTSTGTSTSTITPGGTGAGYSFYDLTLNATGRVALAANTTVTNNLYITNGTLDKNGSTISGTIIQGTNYFTLNSSDVLCAQYLSLSRATTFTPDVSNFTVIDATLSGPGSTITLALGTGTMTSTGLITLAYGDITGTGATIAANNLNLSAGTLDISTGANTLTSTGTIAINGGTFTATNANITANNFSMPAGTFSAPTAGKTFTVSGNWAGGGTFTYNTGTVNFNGAGAQTISNPGLTYSFYNLTTSNSSALSFPSGITLNVNDTLTIGSGTSLAAGTITGINVKGNWTNNGGTFTAGSSTVTFNGTATGKTINPGSSHFYKMTFNGSGGAWSPLTNKVYIDNDLTMTAGTFDTSNGTADVEVAGTVAGTAGIINMTTTNAFTNRIAAAKNFGNTSGTTNWTFNNLKFENSSAGNLTVTAATGSTGQIIVGGTLTIGDATDTNITTLDNETNDRIIDATNVAITSKGSLTASSISSFTVSDSWANSGTFTCGTGTVTFDGTDQTINGSTTFFNFSKTDSNNNSTDLTLTFDSDSTDTQIINGLLTLDGLDNDDRVNLVSDSPGTQWYIIANGTFSIDYVDVTDSNASGGTTIPAGATSIEPGDNNNNWTFKIISVVLRNATDAGDYTTWTIGTGKTVNTVYLMDTDNCVLVKNDGNIAEDFSVQVTATTNWVVSTDGTNDDPNEGVFMGLFNGNAAPVEGAFDTTYDLMLTTVKWATVSAGNGIFEGAANDGDSVAAGSGEKLYIYLKTPTSVTSGLQETITVTIGSREH